MQRHVPILSTTTMKLFCRNICSTYAAQAGPGTWIGLKKYRRQFISGSGLRQGTQCFAGAVRVERGDCGRYICREKEGFQFVWDYQSRSQVASVSSSSLSVWISKPCSPFQSSFILPFSHCVDIWSLTWHSQDWVECPEWHRFICGLGFRILHCPSLWKPFCVKAIWQLQVPTLIGTTRTHRLLNMRKTSTQSPPNIQRTSVFVTPSKYALHLGDRCLLREYAWRQLATSFAVSYSWILLLPTANTQRSKPL